MGTVDIEKINNNQSYCFYIDGKFIKEKNDNSSTSMPISIIEFNSFCARVPTTTHPLPRKKWIELFYYFKKQKENNYKWNSAKRILTELTSFFKTCPAFGVKVIKKGNLIFLQKIDKIVEIKDKNQTTILQANIYKV